jgi:hypothetical protein
VRVVGRDRRYVHIQALPVEVPRLKVRDLHLACRSFAFDNISATVANT